MEKNATQSLLIANEQKFKNTFDDAPVGLALVDLELRITRANVTLAQDILGYSLNEVQGLYIDELLHLSDIDLSAALAKNTEANQKIALEAEKRFIHKSGKVVWGKMTIYLIRNHGGQPICWAVMVADISAEKQAIIDKENALEDKAKTERKLKAIYAALPDLFLIIDNKGKVVEIKSQLIKGQYFPTKIQLQANLGEVEDAAIAAKFTDAIQQVAQTKQAHIFHYTIDIQGVQKYFEAHLQAYSPDNMMVIIRDLSVSKNGEIALTNSQARWRSLFNYATEIIISLDLNGKITAINKTPKEFGKANLNGKNLLEIVDSFTQRILQTALQQVQRTQKSIAFESRVKIPNSTETIYYLSTISPIVIDGSVQAFTLLAREITELKNAQHEAHQNHRFVQQIAATVPDTIFISDLSTHKNIYYNHEPWTVLGYTRREWMQNFLQITHPDDLLAIQHGRKQLTTAADEETITSEYRLKHRNGQWRWFKSRNRVFKRFPDGSVQQIMGIVEDITDKVNHQNALQSISQSISMDSGEAFFKKLVQSLAECLALEYAFLGQINRDTDQMQTLANFENGRLTHNISFDIRQTPCERLFEQSCHIFPENVQDLFPFDEQLPFLEIESYACVTLYDKDKNELGVLAVMGKHAMKDLKLTESLLTIFASRAAYELDRLNKEQKLERHLAEIQQKNKQLEQYINSNLELEKFAYVASHDMKEPLRNIVSFSQLLKRRCAKQLDGEAKEYVDFIVDGTKRMENLINDLLDYSRVNETGKNMTKVDTNFIVEKIAITLRSSIAKYNVQINFQNLPTVWGNELLLTQLFQNLITNAIKFSKGRKQPPQINISAKRDNGYWQFSVQDNGIGIEKQYHNQIFLLFKTLHSKGEFTGTGIGLAICKKIIDKHKGNIWVTSQNDKGSTFYFTMPAVKTH